MAVAGKANEPQDWVGRMLQKAGLLVLHQAGRGAAANLDGAAALLYGLLRYVWPYRRGVIEQNGRLALGLAGQQLADLRDGFYRHFANLIAEILVAFNLPADAIARRVRCDFDNMNLAAANAGGCIVLTGHLCNWEWLLIGGARAVEGDLLGVYQPLSQAFFDEIIRGLRAKGGAIPLPQKQILRALSARDSAKPLVLSMVADQAPPQESFVPARLGLHPTGFFTGPEALARRLGWPCFYLKMAPGKLPHTYTSTMVPLPDTDTVAAFAQMLSADIAAHPHLYLWSHNRFKHIYPAAQA